MIQVVPAKHPQLKGGNPFGFRTNQKRTTHRSLRGTREDYQIQVDRVVKMELMLEQLQHFPCEFSLVFGVEESTQILDGEVKVYDGHAQRQAQMVVRDVSTSLASFWAMYPESGFKIEATQVMTITKIYPPGA